MPNRGRPGAWFRGGAQNLRCDRFRRSLRRACAWPCSEFVPFDDHVPYCGEYVVGVHGGIDDDATLLVAPRYIEKGATQPFVECDVETLEARRTVGALCGARQARFDGQIKNESEVGTKVMQHDGVEPAYRFARQSPARALISKCGVREAVADHPFFVGKRRSDGARHMIGARREDEKRFGEWIPATLLAVNNEFSNLLGSRRAAGFTRRDAADAALLQCGRNFFRLRGFSGALSAFERDEATGRYHLLPPKSARMPSIMRPKIPNRETSWAA